jgi:hypothetical protein
MNETIKQIKAIDRAIIKLKAFKGYGQLVLLVATGKVNGEYIDPVELEFGCHTDTDYQINVLLSACQERKEALFPQVYKDLAELQNFLQLQERD